MSTETEQPLAVRNASNLSSEVIEKLALAGDVSGLTREEKIQYYRSLCARVGLDSATQPFKLLKLQGKEIFYCDRSGAQQLSRLHNVTHEVRAREIVNECYVVTVRASSNGRSTESIGAVPIAGLKGEALCNAYMKAETKGKRRATLDLLGLGMLDETEVSTIPGARTEAVETPVARLPASTPVQTPLAQQNPVATQARPKEAPPCVATEATKEWMLKALEEMFGSEAVHEYATKNGVLLDTESNADWPMNKVTTSREALGQLQKAMHVFFDGGVPTTAEPASAGTRNADDAEDDLPFDAGDAPLPKEDEAFKTFVVPYGRFAGKTLGQLPKRTLYGFWAGHTVATEYNGKPKRPETIAKDQAFRDALDAAGKHYEFTR